MPDKRNSVPLIIVAVLTAAALIGLAFYKRSGGTVDLSDTTFYIAAAVIVLAPVLWAVVRKAGRSKA